MINDNKRMGNYEIEIKCLLGNVESGERLRKKMRELDPGLKFLGKNSQLNHYFVGGNLQSLYESLAGHLSKEGWGKLKSQLDRLVNISLRTREQDGKVFLVIKASLGDDSSANGIARFEFQEPIIGLPLAGLDDLILKAGFKYQSKWSREREEYLFRDVYVTIDKNAGYGYLAEFELSLDDASAAEKAESKLRDIIAELELEELRQDRLERMFEYYNAHWPEYYGTDKVFTVE